MKGTKVTDNLELAKLVEKTLPFLAALDPVVSVAFFLEDIFTLKDMTRTLLFLTASSLAILFFELAIAMLPVALMLYILSNSYYMKRYQVSRPKIARTVPWILAQMEAGIAIRPKVDRLVSDVVFWGKPQFSLLVIKAAVPASISMFVGLRYMPLRNVAASSIWVPVLSQVEFFKVLGQAVTLQLSETDFEALIFEYKNDLMVLASRFEPSELNRARI